MGPEPEGIYQVRASHNLAAVSVTFDEDNLVPNAGLMAPALLAQRLDVAGLVQRRVRLAPGSARGAGTLLAETVSRVRDAGATGALTVRADSAFYSKAFLGAARTADVRFSVTVRQDAKVRAAIDAIGEDAWTPIPVLDRRP